MRRKREGVLILDLPNEEPIHVELTKVGVPRPFEPFRVSGAVEPVLHQAMNDFMEQT